MFVLFDDVGDGIPLPYPLSLIAYIFFLFLFFSVAMYSTSWALDRGKRIVIDETAGIVTVEQLRWLFHGERYSLPLAAVTAVVIDNEPTPSPESADQRVSIVTDLQGRERIEVASGKKREMLSVGIVLSELLHSTLQDYLEVSGPCMHP